VREKMNVKIIVISEPVKHFNKHSVCFETEVFVNNLAELNDKTSELQKLANLRSKHGLQNQIEGVKEVKI